MSTPSDQQSFSGWMLYRGEVMLFSSEAELQGTLKQRNNEIRCISGVLAGQDRDLRSWDGQRVIVTGKLVNYWSLAEEDFPFLQRKMVGDKVIKNFCLRDQIIVITRIERAPA